MTQQNRRPITFRFSEDGPVFHGTTGDRTWNGWPIVRITVEERDRMASLWESEGYNEGAQDFRDLTVEDGTVSLLGYTPEEVHEVCPDCGRMSPNACPWEQAHCGECSLARDLADEQAEVCPAHGAYLPDPEA